MGFLDNSSNNIILDAVLTDIGRQFLARNDGSFSIVKYALSDDEINYAIIRKYGRTVGKEKIEKNTPIFEALTSSAQAQKYRLISVSNQFLVRLPSLSLLAVQGSSVFLGFGTGSVKTTPVTVEQTILNDTEIPSDLTDSTFMVEMSNMFLEISTSRPDSIDSQQRVTYILNGTGINSQKGGRLTFSLSLKSFSSSLFDVYGPVLDKTQINTYVRVTGLVSGAVKEFVVNISK